MSKKCFLCLCGVLLAGCVSDRLTFHQAGNATVSDTHICIISPPGEVLKYFSLSSSENNYTSPLVTRDNIAKKYPDTCVPFELKNTTQYELIYELDDTKFRFEFITDEDKKITKTYSQS